MKNILELVNRPDTLLKEEGKLARRLFEQVKDIDERNRALLENDCAWMVPSYFAKGVSSNYGPSFVWGGDHQSVRPNNIVNLFLWKPHYDFSFENFLDLGCGSGFPVGLALKLGFNAYGVDNDPKMVHIARKNLEMNKESSKRVVKGDYLSKEFWERKLGGISPAEFDVLYLYNWENKMPGILKYISRKVSNKARVAVSGEQPYVLSKISARGEKGFEALGWKIDIKIPDITILKRA